MNSFARVVRRGVHQSLDLGEGCDWSDETLITVVRAGGWRRSIDRVDWRRGLQGGVRLAHS